MRCNRCDRKMIEEKRSFHKQRKWRCPTCGRSRFQRNRSSKWSARSAKYRRGD